MNAECTRVIINNAIVGNQFTGGGEASGLFITGSSLTSLHTALPANEGGNGAALVLADTSVVTMTNTIIAGHATGVLAEGYHVVSCCHPVFHQPLLSQLFPISGLFTQFVRYDRHSEQDLWPIEALFWGAVCHSAPVCLTEVRWA